MNLITLDPIFFFKFLFGKHDIEHVSLVLDKLLVELVGLHQPTTVKLVFNDLLLNYSLAEPELVDTVNEELLRDVQTLCLLAETLDCLGPQSVVLDDFFESKKFILAQNHEVQCFDTLASEVDHLVACHGLPFLHPDHSTIYLLKHDLASRLQRKAQFLVIFVN